MRSRMARQIFFGRERTVLCGRRRAYRADGSPEWYYWGNLPATCFAVLDGRLWFGAADGRVLRLCERDEADAFLDDGAAIDAWWCTPDLPLGGWGREKLVREVAPVLMPYTRSGVKVTYETDAGEVLALDRNLDLFSFETLDFSRFTFRCRPGAVQMRVRRKLHRARTVRVRIRNNPAGRTVRPARPRGAVCPRRARRVRKGGMHAVPVL